MMIGGLGYGKVIIGIKVHFLDLQSGGRWVGLDLGVDDGVAVRAGVLVGPTAVVAVGVRVGVEVEVGGGVDEDVAVGGGGLPV